MSQSMDSKEGEAKAPKMAVGLADLARLVDSEPLLMELAQAAGGLEGGERLAAALTSPKSPRPSKTMLARELRSETAGTAYAWQGWEGSKLPAMARLAIKRAAQSKRGNSLWGGREMDVWGAMSATALKAVRRPDAAQNGISRSALDLLERHFEAGHPYEVKPILAALAVNGDAVGFERLCAMLPAKTEPNPAWTPQELKEARDKALGRTVARQFWAYGVQGAESSRTGGFAEPLSRVKEPSASWRDTAAPFMSALARWPNEPERAMELLRRGWRAGGSDTAWAAAKLDDARWAEFERLRGVAWLETGDSARRSMWGSDESRVALFALLIALDTDDAAGLRRLGGRFPELQKEIDSPKSKSDLGAWSLLGLAAAMGASSCLEALGPAALAQKGVKAVPTRALAFESAKAGSARVAYATNEGFGRLESGVKIVGEAHDWRAEEKKLPELWRLSLAEAALLSGEKATLQAASALERGFAGRVAEALDRFSSILPDAWREAAAAWVQESAPAAKRKPKA